MRHHITWRGCLLLLSSKWEVWKPATTWSDAGQSDKQSAQSSICITWKHSCPIWLGFIHQFAAKTKTMHLTVLASTYKSPKCYGVDLLQTKYERMEKIATNQAATMRTFAPCFDDRTQPRRILWSLNKAAFPCNQNAYFIGPRITECRMSHLSNGQRRFEGYLECRFSEWRVAQFLLWTC